MCLLQHASEVWIDGFGGIDVVVELYGVLVHFGSTSGTDHLGFRHLETFSWELVEQDGKSLQVG
jgi:hypothetical protein